MASSRDVTSRLRERVWNGSIALEIRLHKGDCRTYDDSDPYLVCLLYLNSEFEFEFE
jgi:autophagy-related protein 5